LARCAQQEGVRSGRKLAQQAILAVVNSRGACNLRQVTAHQREMMLLAGHADAPDPLERILVPEMTAQRIAGIRRVDDHAALPNDVNGAPDEPQLRVQGVNLEELTHPAMIRGLLAAP